MSWELAAWLLLGGSTVLIFLGLPVAFAFIAINLAGALLWLGGEPGLVQLARNSVSSVTSFSLTPIPLFVLMGEILFHTGLAVKVIDGIERLIHQVPGRLAVFGFGDFAFAADTHPALSTVRIDGTGIGRQAARFIVDRAEGRPVGDRVVDIGFSIVERAST